MKQKKSQIYLLTFLVITVFFTLPLKAQVTIGDNVAPHKFSILELITKNKDGGLRLPQLTTGERDGLNFASNPDAAQGLVIYNTTTNCLEFWNGKEWISMCSDILDCSKTVFPVLGSSYTLCTGSTFADLTTSAGGNVKWYNTETGGNAYDPSSTLTNGAIYYAEQTISGCTNPQRTSVTVTLGDCSRSLLTPNITTYVNVMYDFQHQTLEAYWDATGGIPTKYEWQVSTSSDGSFQDIAGAPNSNFYTVPADYIYNYSSETDSLFFRCILSNSQGSVQTPNDFNILFIRTTDGHGNFVGNYDKDENGVRYLTINRGGSLNGGKIRIMLLNLGQSGTGSLNTDPLYNDSRNLNDAGDLGDFYQWGRVADGHEYTVWSKDLSTRVIQIIPMTGNGATSLPVARNTSLQVYNSNGNGQIDPSNTGFYGNFIYNIGDWGQEATSNSDLWGNTYNNRFTGANATTSSPISLNGVPPTWTPRAQSNNPCPDGWRVPSRFEFSDIYNGNGSDPDGTYGDYGTVASGNTWRWRDNSPSGTQAIGGVIISISNSSDEKIFLPAAGFRIYNSGALSSIGNYGYYWSSTNSDRMYAYDMNIYSTGVGAGIDDDLSAFGFSVRCVSE